MQDFVNNDPAQFDDPLSDYEPDEYQDELQWALAEKTVDAIESRPYHWVSPETTVREAIQIMAKTQSASLLVLADQRVLGIFTERDVLERVAEQYWRLANQPVRDVMTKDPAVVYDSDPAAAAIASIAIAGHRHVPVLGMDNQVVGVIGPRRVLQFVEQFYD